MKKSFYNLEKKINDSLLIYNSFTGAVVSLDQINKNYYENGDFDKIKELKQLVEFGIVVENENEQFDELKKASNLYHKQSNRLYVTILSTTLCNLRCVYCFESIRNLTMTNDVIEGMISFFKKTLIENSYTELHVTWFGGEPLFYPQLVKKIYSLIEDLVDQLNVKFSNSIVTNGTFLSEDNVNVLKTMRNLESVQITIDGCKEIHDIRRPLKGASSFDLITQNIKKYGLYLPLAIRVNVDKDNISGIENFIKELSYLFDGANNLIVYFGRVVGSPSSYTSYEFAKIKSNLYKILKKYNFTNSVTNYLPKIQPVQCSAITKHMMVVDANGDLYTCWEVVGDSKYKIGTVFEGVTSKEWPLNSTEKEECLTCKVYPICRSGCPKQYKDPLKDNCMYIPEILINDIEELVVND